MEKQMLVKKLCRIRLINWHYFINETICVNGSFLVSGENTSGKSTILDAIQLVLTTNTRRFNTAANEKSSRSLKGYVRCKTGNEDNAYLRKGSVITYVALEFFEQKTSKYFTLGVKIDSPDEESKLTTKWFREECRLEDISFLNGGRPATTEEFRKNDKKIQLIPQLSEAKAVFARRLGNLENRFFDMIPKSLAFKPMDNVKDFINKFILPERTIEVATLRNNIAVLKELEDLMGITKDKINSLQDILAMNEHIVIKEREISTNEVLIQKAGIEAKKLEREQLQNQNQINEQKLRNEQTQELTLNEKLEVERERLTNLQIALNQNETTKLISDTKNQIKMLEKDKQLSQQNVNKLQDMINNLVDALSLLGKHDIRVLTKEELNQLTAIDCELEDKVTVLISLEKAWEELSERFNGERYQLHDLLNTYQSKQVALEADIKNLKNKKLTYPENTTKLKAAIEKEFLQRGIRSEVRIFSDLLEVIDATWQNAVEGYLNTQRFYIIVDPQHYKVALDVYNKVKKEIHSVGLVDTGKLDTEAQVDHDSLAYVVKSDNRWAKAYAVYLLNKVIRCENVQELKKYNVAITPDCMLYQNYAVRKINEKVYLTPYIGARAFEIQLLNKQAELESVKLNSKLEQEKLSINKQILEKLKSVTLDVINEHLSAPEELMRVEQQIASEIQELRKAEQDPSYIEIQIQIEEQRTNVKNMEEQYKLAIRRIGELGNRIETNKNNIRFMEQQIENLEQQFVSLCTEDTEAAVLGMKKFDEQMKQKAPVIIVQNFSPMKVGLENKKKEFANQLIDLQSQYCRKYDCDLGTGHEQIDDYVKEHHKLISADIIKYEEDLNKAKENCELEFRESFLAKLKENIENARLEFKYLNAALKDIYYGEDRYKFEITHDKKKENIYQMITAKNNVDGYTLWSNSFDEDYKEEMEDLFAKLTAYDDKGEKVLAEYTDYRSYLDYDIIVEKQDGTVQRFSKIYGEKSGGETQTPYYVAIAASFVQLYKLGDTIRIIMLDEAFDKMDDNRISSMMDFFNSQGFQIILATPPAKVEIIGEKVDTILMAIREGTTSIIEEYDL